jgi:hypothetical protein
LSKRNREVTMEEKQIVLRNRDKSMATFFDISVIENYVHMENN